MYNNSFNLCWHKIVHYPLFFREKKLTKSAVWQRFPGQTKPFGITEYYRLKLNYPPYETGKIVFPFKKFWYKTPNKNVFARHHRYLSSHRLYIQLGVRAAFGGFTTPWTVSFARVQLKTQFVQRTYSNFFQNCWGLLRMFLAAPRHWPALSHYQFIALIYLSEVGNSPKPVY